MLLTSREFDVLSIGMDIQKNFPINALSEEETWELFKKMAGDNFFFHLSISYITT
jgi:disease resistance protein RPS2